MVDPIEAGIRFMETAARNWCKIPPLSHDDFADVGQALEWKLRKAREEGARAMQEAAERRLKAMAGQWRDNERKYRNAGNPGPYLGAPSYTEAARQVSALSPADIVKGIGQ